jgi:hypothetical protein
LCVVFLQWCGIGFTQLPNGIGFGGQVGHYGLWLDSTMDHGMSRPAATFARCAALAQTVSQAAAGLPSKLAHNHVPA